MTFKSGAIQSLVTKNFKHGKLTGKLGRKAARLAIRLAAKANQKASLRSPKTLN